MEKFLEKMDEYNIINYILPGIIFTYLLKYYVKVDIFQINIFEMFFIYYFIGSIISRIGSIVLEELLLKVKFIKYSPKKDFISATQKDKLIEKLLISNNMYRTLCATFMVILIIKIIKLIIEKIYILHSFFCTTAIIVGMLIYLFSYKKQTKKIFERVDIEK